MEYFFGILVNKDGKWTPHAKYDGASFGSALMKAETIDQDGTFDGVKIMKISSDGKENKEVWISPRLKGRAEAAATAKVRAGVRQTKEQLKTARLQSVKK